MIRGFKDKQTERIFNRQFTKKLPQDLHRLAYRKLLLIHATADVSELRIPPGNRLEQLKGDRAGQYSIRINDQWRICFVWRDGNAFEVEICDYH
ncbi:type II toxin-antitoxin system RelE/ParE family toxin [Emcibacter nanhaiensis]|uniref:Type II toxin-antitoxin system RelE/ParE family toxin n=1 Tax=Emcibacter nanhaiensis TaxID=1505037 RepID=A0A501PP81_9PROT|nr:type II toxin-antitoxin system RelE/ParE family toxin [Emcibacter nanhaiensis]TPD61794.1 type II toxin-antitoxin system RelE/ParE family toxin [Emcibacter nanhaiensis]